MAEITICGRADLGLDAGVYTQPYPTLVFIEVAKSCSVLIWEVFCRQVALIDDLLMDHLGLLRLKFVPQIIVGLVILNLFLCIQCSLVHVVFELLIFAHDKRAYWVCHASFRAQYTSSAYAVVLRMLRVCFEFAISKRLGGC
jgi:hypothetical protein